MLVPDRLCCGENRARFQGEIGEKRELFCVAYPQADHCITMHEDWLHAHHAQTSPRAYMLRRRQVWTGLELVVSSGWWLHLQTEAKLLNKGSIRKLNLIYFPGKCVANREPHPLTGWPLPSPEASLHPDSTLRYDHARPAVKARQEIIC